MSSLTLGQQLQKPGKWQFTRNFKVLRRTAGELIKCLEIFQSNHCY